MWQDRESEVPVSEQEEDFAAMFEASVKARQFARGQTVEGTIVGIGPKFAFVNIGGKGEAEIDVAELKDTDGDIDVNVGDRIQAMVVSTSGGIVLSRKGVRNAVTQRELEDAFNAGLAVEGKVVQRSEEHTSELQSQSNLVCRLLLEKKK